MPATLTPIQSVATSAHAASPTPIAIAAVSPDRAFMSPNTVVAGTPEVVAGTPEAVAGICGMVDAPLIAPSSKLATSAGAGPEALGGVETSAGGLELSGRVAAWGDTTEAARRGPYGASAAVSSPTLW